MNWPCEKNVQFPLIIQLQIYDRAVEENIVISLSYLRTFVVGTGYLYTTYVIPINVVLEGKI